MSSRRPSRVASVPSILLLGLALAASPVAGTDRDAAMGAAGELFIVQEGTYGELFPGQGLADPANAALALDLIRSDQTKERLLVPGTETPDAEDSASILFEDQSGTLFVLWQTMVRSIHSQLVLVGFRDGEWGEPIEISGSFFGWKSAPQLAVTRDNFRTVESDGSLRTWTRTVAHLIWWEEGPGGEPSAYYSPVTFLDGAYAGWNPVYKLDELELGAGAQPLTAVSPLARAPRIEPGRNGQSVVMAFLPAGTGKLVTVEMEVLPGEISFVADKVRHQIIDVGRALPPSQRNQLADRVRHQIIDVGARLNVHPSVTAYAAEQATATILAAPSDEEPSSLAERVRHQIIDVGARMTDRGLVRVRAAQQLEILETSNGDVAGAPANHLRVLEVSSRPTPQIGAVESALFLSRSGGEVLASWVEDGMVFYRESRGEGWSEPRSLQLGQGLELARAYEILERRADERGDE